MTHAHARIVVGATGNDGQIELDGQRIEHAVRGFTLTSAVGEITRLELDVVLLRGAAADGEVFVRIPQESHDLLVALGWTPPGADHGQG